MQMIVAARQIAACHLTGTEKYLSTSKEENEFVEANSTRRREVYMMKYSGFLGILILLMLAGFAGCGEPPAPPTSHGGPIRDYVSLIDHLRASTTVVPAGSVNQPGLSVTGYLIKVNGEDVQVYEYADEDAANTEASHISPDGGTIGTTMVDWVAPPHFFKKGRIIVLYVGTTPSVLQVLRMNLGPQFAGR